MIIQGSKILSFLNFSVVYYVMQLGRCAFLSLLAFALVVLLRKTLPKHRIFLKGAVWSFFLPVLFAGKMKFFYQHPAGVKLFSWWTRICMNHAWVCWLYLWGMVLFAVSLILKRRKTKRLAAGLEKRVLDLGILYVTEMPVSPFAIGVFCPKIIMPEIFLKEFDREEIQTILLHETIHIWLGHLLFYLLWDIMRVLLWINPLLIIGTKFFREDLEEICDWVTIRQSKGTAYDYGRLLVKSMRLLQAEKEEFNMFAAFAGDSEYQNILQRVTGIARYRAYRRSWPVTLSAAALLCAIGTVFWIQHCSYGKCNEDDNVFVYGYDGPASLFLRKMMF